MTLLSERAEAARQFLEGEWGKHHLKGRYKRWHSRPLVNRLRQPTLCGTELDGWEALRELTEAGLVETSQPVSARQRLNVRVQLSEALRHRLASEFARVDASLPLDAGQAALWRHALESVLDGWDLADQRRLAEGLNDLAAALPGAHVLSSYEASARYLLGSSKLLDALPRELVRAFGIERAAFRGPGAWVLAAVPAEPQGVLLIENPQSFEQACRAGVAGRLALLCSFGYGLSLSEALRAPERVRLIGEIDPLQTLDGLLALENVTYWGDLDPEGLRIFRWLRQSVATLRLSALYAPMIERLEREGGHPLHRLTGKGGQRPAPGWSRGLDQEALGDAEVAALAGDALEAEREDHWLGLLADSDLDAMPGGAV
ncbi:Wadjet anti-phage system protein JetD domain-containing protein [Modicisalibacter radicis]|uniref:Wadjet anti-phage system protein JetD domain-containing protein n=1 Tax=Halomonas sp. EAR18 TaxID=2518972 RepID=UPI00109C5433|nr:Wadjet anti-phage system protein JetD domain-containing protein [Halomonas sp. EAR18]